MRGSATLRPRRAANAAQFERQAHVFCQSLPGKQQRLLRHEAQPAIDPQHHLPVMAHGAACRTQQPGRHL